VDLDPGKPLANIVLVSPEIPHNTGNIIRLCANTGSRLHLVEPFNFQLENAKLKRAALDYSDLTNVHTYRSIDELFKNLATDRIFAAVPGGYASYAGLEYQRGDTILFGSESVGLPDTVLKRLPSTHLIHIPMAPSNRSLNLSNAVAVIVYEMWRQLKFTESEDRGPSCDVYFS
jgi:tRNA (cytidine/uridine-2'-O-)-methyltransferase